MGTIEKNTIAGKIVLLLPVKAGEDSGPGNPSDDVHPRTSENM